MGQKIRPIGFRVGIMEDWRSRWYANKQEYSELLVEDHKIRSFLNKRFPRAGIARIEIERTRDEVKVVLFTSRPGGVIGRKGTEIERVTALLEKLTGRRINLKVEKIDNPQVNAQLVAEDIAEQLEKRASFRRTMKKAIEATMEAGARGIKISLAGRLGGAEMSRHEKAVEGRVPLQTLRARIDYGFAEALISQGHIGIKVWINNGDYLEDDSRAPHAEAGKVSKKPARPRPRAGQPG
jgi:small subunit ribosomal protein S3